MMFVNFVLVIFLFFLCEMTYVYNDSVVVSRMFPYIKLDVDTHREFFSSTPPVYAPLHSAYSFIGTAELSEAPPTGSVYTHSPVKCALSLDKFKWIGIAFKDTDAGYCMFGTDDAKESILKMRGSKNPYGHYSIDGKIITGLLSSGVFALYQKNRGM